MEWAARKKRIPEAVVRAVMGPYNGSYTKVNVGTHFSEKLEVNVGVHEGSVLSPLLFAIVIEVVTNVIIEGTL